MTQNQQLVNSVACLMELASNDDQACVQMQAELQTLYNELNSINESNPEKGIHEQLDPQSNLFIQERDNLIYELKNSINNQNAAHFLIKNLPDIQSHACHKLGEIVKTLANLANLYYDPNQLKTMSGICQFVDQNWEILEPKTNDIIIIDCSSRGQNDDEY